MASSLTIPSLLITMLNNCGYGETFLVNLNTTNADAPATVNLATGNGTYATTQPLFANAYFDNGYCTVNGGNCSSVTIAFDNGTTDTSMALAPPDGFSAPFSFSYDNGCNFGLLCPDASCLENGPATVECDYSEGETGLEIVFCPTTPDSTSSSTAAAAASTSPASSNASISTHSNTGTVIGAVIGGLILLVAIAVVIFLARRRRHHQLNASREKFEFSTRPWRSADGTGTGAQQNINSTNKNPADPFKDPTPRSGSPAGWSVTGEMPMKVVYSDTSMPYNLPPLKFEA